MLIACKAACKQCSALQTPSPFSEVQVSSGWVMPTVGFGTAGLGVGTAQAVEYAAAAGYRMFDSAEVGWRGGIARGWSAWQRYGRVACHSWEGTLQLYVPL